MSEAPDTAPADAIDGRPSLVGTVVATRYRVEAMIGTGGMGTVYRAEHVHMKKTLALKVLHRELATVDEVIARFEREAIAAARIEHPNVARATDFGRLEDGSLYLVMEFVSGRSLGSLIVQGGIDIERALHITGQIAAAMEAAHEAGVVHRDLKPDNVLLVEREGDLDSVKVLDFGIAKVQLAEGGSSSQLTQMGSVFGTPEYMAPEQASGGAVDHRADLYALGVLLYELLTGKTPFDHADIVVLLTQQLTLPPPPLPDRVPEDVRALVMELLAKDPAERIQTAHEVAVRISKILDRRAALALATTQLAVEAPERPAPERPRRTLLIAAAAAGALLLLVAGGLALGSASTPEPVTELRAGAFDVELPRIEKKARSAQPSVVPSTGAAQSKSAGSAPQKTPRKTSSDKKSSSKKKTGPGGIYIPPPSDWF